ncbi:MAG: ketopantoate reductase family protein [Planctomycetota bacterium]|jgi:2-dehydropantoate 2-reductase
MKVLIYGGGSVGLGIASCLLKSGTQVDILTRETTVRTLRQDGLVRTGIFGEYHAAPASFRCYSSLTEVHAGPYDFILVCTKSFDSFEAAEDLSQHELLFGDDTKIVLFQNGWGNAEAFLPFFSEDRIHSARVITGFRRVHANEVTMTVHADSIHIGSLFDCDPSCLCEITDSIEKDLWAKMLYNCALNPLGAVLDVPYGALAEHEYTRVIMNGIVEEVFEVISAAGYQTHWTSAKDFLDVFYRKLVPDTAEHKSSTLQDILAKKKTEIEALNGAVIKLAQEYDMNVPNNLVLYNMVKSIENR